MMVVNASIRKKRRMKKCHTIAITMRLFLESQQPSNTSKSSNYLSRYSSTESGSYECESEDDMDLFDKPLQPISTLDSRHDLAMIGGSIAAYSQKMFLELQLSNRSTNNSRDWPTFQDKSKGRAQHEPTDIIDESPIPTQQRFACPFYYRDRQKHLQCLTRADLLNIKDVKQHLWYTHRLQPYCPTCGESFATTAKSDAHIRSRSCDPQNIPRPEGISLPQMQELARRAEVWMSEDLQWLSLWEIVFPGAELPDITYPSRTVEFIVCQFRDYWSTRGNGETIIYEFLRERGFHEENLRDEKHTLEALQALILNQSIDHLVEAFTNVGDNTISAKVEEVLASLQCS
ncbi:hypothetical protein F5B19DRAFT_434429 [Rostrohypoxylon terebratum]|nr:hypothetical protein F5B19DRAFT_434429 [Rostrohypoxylon terebratum]